MHRYDIITAVQILRNNSVLRNALMEVRGIHYISYEQESDYRAGGTDVPWTRWSNDFETTLFSERLQQESPVTVEHGTPNSAYLSI